MNNLKCVKINCSAMESDQLTCTGCKSNLYTYTVNKKYCVLKEDYEDCEVIPDINPKSGNPPICQKCK